jgi:uncharacterized protein involved in exopolysaccharide biosynthesis
MEQRSLYLIRQALTAVFKRWRMVAMLFLLIFVPSNVGNLVRDPVYRATAKVMIRSLRAYPEVSPLARQASAERPPNEAVINSEMQLIRSADLLRRLHFELAAQKAESGEDDSRVPTVAAMDQKLIVTRRPNSNVLEIAYRSSDQEEAINVVNTLVRLYVEYSIEQQREPGATEFFYEQAKSAKDAYEQADLELERYDAAHGLTSIAVEKDQMLRQRAQLEADLRRSEAEITELTTKVAALQAELEYIPEHEAIEVDMIPNPMLGYLRQNLVRLEMEKARLEQLYTPQHRLVRDLDGEIGNLKQQIVAQETSIIGRKKMATTSVRRGVEQDVLQAQADLGALEARRAMLTERISDYDARIRVMHAKHYQVMRMRRDRTTKKRVYDALEEKLSQLQVSDAMDRAGLSNVSVVEAAATPLKPEPDFKGVTFLLSVFAALLISLGSAVASEMLNPVLNSEVDIRHHLGLPLIAEIPRNGVIGRERAGPPGQVNSA